MHTNNVDAMKMRVELHNRRQAELEPVELSEEGAAIAAIAALYLETVALFRTLGAAPRYA